MNKSLRPFTSIGYTGIIVGILTSITTFSGVNIGIGSKSIGGAIGYLIDLSVPILATIYGVIFLLKRIEFSSSEIILIGIIKKRKRVPILISEIKNWNYSPISDEFKINMNNSEEIVIPAKNDSPMKIEIYEHLSKAIKSL